jgi:hypothetical protein
MAEYYDLVLGAIPIAVAVVVAGLSLDGIVAPAAVTVGSLTAVGLVCHAMFVRTPGRVDANDPSTGRSGSETGFDTAD